MAHKEQMDFCNSVKERFSNFFSNKKVLDGGSLDINGNNRYLFSDCEYLGIDVGMGKNVDIVTPIHLFNYPNESFDVIISTECFEHDMYYEQSFKNICRLLKSGGLFLFTCGTTGRHEHGTIRTTPQYSPLTSSILGWGDYYRNIDENDVRKAIDVDDMFPQHEFIINEFDLYFWGIKK